MLDRKTKEKKVPLDSKVHEHPSWLRGGGEWWWGWGVKSVHNLDLEAERNKTARHTGRLEVENTAAK